MSTTTPRLLLKKPSGSEAFLRSDFDQNWDALDRNPGIAVIANSGARPSFSAVHEGQVLYEKDAQRLIAYGPSGYVPLHQFAFAVQRVHGSNDTIAKNATKAYPTPAWSVTLPRAGAILIMGTVRLSQDAGLQQTAVYRLYVDNHLATWTDDSALDQSTIRFPDAGAGAAGLLGVAMPIFGYYGGLAAGNHTVQIKITTGALSNDAISYTGSQVSCLFLEA